MDFSKIGQILGLLGSKEFEEGKFRLNNALERAKELIEAIQMLMKAFEAITNKIKGQK